MCEEIIDSMLKREFVRQTELHINDVRKRCSKFKEKLSDQIFVHDKSKLKEPEVSLFVPVLSFEEYEYGSEEHIEQSKKISKAVEEHTKHNPHHPGAHENGMSGFDLITLIECYLDWASACEMRGDGDILHSIGVQKERFDIPDMLYSILVNTAKKYGGFSKLN